MEPHPQVWIRHVLQANDTLDYLDYFKRCPKPTLHDRMPFYLLTVILTDRYVVTQPVWTWSAAKDNRRTDKQRRNCSLCKDRYFCVSSLSLVFKGMPGECQTHAHPLNIALPKESIPYT